MKNFFYTTEIANKIKDLLDEKLPEEAAKNISVGDFTVLPGPDELDDYLPAVIINVEENEIEAGNIALNIYNQEYFYKIYYIYPYTFQEFEDVPIEAIKNAEIIANILMNYPKLENFTIEQTDEDIGGEIIGSSVASINYDSVETDIFRNIQVPAYVTPIEYYSLFRTYRSIERRY